MKVLAIESPSKLKDGKVKASIVVSNEDFIPLIMLMDAADKGEGVGIDKVTEVKPSDEMQPFIIMLQELLLKEYKRGMDFAVKQLEKTEKGD